MNSESQLCQVESPTRVSGAGCAGFAARRHILSFAYPEGWVERCLEKVVAVVADGFHSNREDEVEDVLLVVACREEGYRVLVGGASAAVELMGPSRCAARLACLGGRLC